MDRRASLIFALVLLFVPPLRSLMFLFLIMSLAARKFFNLLLLLDPFGKRILTEDERASTACFGIWFACLVTCITNFIIFKPTAVVAPLAISLLFLILIPLMKVFDVTEGLRRNILAAITTATALLGVWLVISSGLGGRSYEYLSNLERTLAGLFVLICLLAFFYPTGKKE
jgi:hypothetical protein